MSEENPFSTDFESPKSEFNVALATAFYVHNLRIGINKAMWENNQDGAFDLLSSMSCEIEGYYLSKNKKKSKDIIKELSAQETKVQNLIKDPRGNSNQLLCKIELKKWRNKLVAIAHDIWFSKEKSNIYGDDFD